MLLPSLMFLVFCFTKRTMTFVKVCVDLFDILAWQQSLLWSIKESKNVKKGIGSSKRSRFEAVLPVMLLSTAKWIFESQVEVVRDHRNVLKKCGKAGSITARLVAMWAPIMCFPQWVIALGFGLLGHNAAWAIFAGRMAAMCIVRKLDEVIPFTRALGLCHLLTFGPVLGYLTLYPPDVSLTPYFAKFLSFERCVISLCLFMDARDLLLHCLGYPFPCYIRKGVHAGVIPVQDPRAKSPVTVWSMLVGP